MHTEKIDRYDYYETSPMTHNANDKYMPLLLRVGKMRMKYY